MQRVDAASKVDSRPVSTHIFHSRIKLTIIQKSKFNVGDEVYIRIRGSFQHRGPYLIAKVLGGCKYTLCEYDGVIAESGREVDEKDLVAQTTLDGN